MSKSICFPTDLPSRKNNNTEFPINETKHLCLLCKLKQSKWICVLHEKPNPQRDPIAATNLMQRLIQKICKEIQVLWWYGVLERCAKRERIKERKIKTKDGESIEVTCLLKQTLKPGSSERWGKMFRPGHKAYFESENNGDLTDQKPFPCPYCNSVQVCSSTRRTQEGTLFQC